MKKNIGKLILLILVVVGIFFAKNYIDKKTFNYSEIVDGSLSSYYVSGAINDLKPIIELIEKYKKDEKMLYNIQTYSFEVVGGWYTYLDDKYICDKNNLNSCKAQLAEFKILTTKLNDLYTYRSSNSYTIILPSAYNNLKTEGEKKMSGLEKIIASPSAKNPYNSEEIRLQKCSKAVDCDGCRDGLCKCYYVNENKTRESISCKDTSEK